MYVCTGGFLIRCTGDFLFDIPVVHIWTIGFLFDVPLVLWFDVCTGVFLIPCTSGFYSIYQWFTSEPLFFDSMYRWFFIRYTCGSRLNHWFLIRCTTGSLIWCMYRWFFDSMYHWFFDLMYVPVVFWFDVPVVFIKFTSGSRLSHCFLIRCTSVARLNHWFSRFWFDLHLRFRFKWIQRCFPIFTRAFWKNSLRMGRKHLLEFLSDLFFCENTIEYTLMNFGVIKAKLFVLFSVLTTTRCPGGIRSHDP
jgi:hypothetical protein